LIELTEDDLFQLVECVKHSDWNSMPGKPDYQILNKIEKNPEEYLQALNIMKDKAERLQKYVEYLYQLSVKGKLDTQSITILIQLGNWVKNGDSGLAPDEFRKKNETKHS